MKKLFFCALFIAVMLLTPLGIIAGNVYLSETNVLADGVGKVAVPVNKDNINLIAEDLSGHYILDDNISFTDIAKSFGSKEAPFTGIFDGDGNTITISRAFLCGQYQGFFGYANGAIIKNVKIKLEDVVPLSSEDPSSKVAYDEIVVGAIVGHGVSTTIMNCEVDGNIIDYKEAEKYPLACKFTMGGIIGKAERCSISKCGVYLDVDLSYEQANVFINKFGGIVGQADNYSILDFCVAYTDLSLVNSSEKIVAENQLGGIAGSFGGKYSNLTNCVSDFRISVDLLKDEKEKASGLIGVISSPVPESGNIRSCGYYAFNNTSKKQIESFNGDENSPYTLSSTSTNDYLVSLSDGGKLETKAFFESGDVKWDLNEWDFLADWIIADSKVKLQDFQNFDLELSEFLDQNDLLQIKEGVEGCQEEYKGVRYGTKVAFAVEFIEPEDNYYFKIDNVIKEGGNNEKPLSYTLEKVSNETSSYYLLKLQASAETEGVYSFYVKEIQYDAYVISSNGGKVKTASSSTLNDHLEKRALMKNFFAYDIQAKPDYTYKFSSWTLWQATTEEIYNQNVNDIVNYMKHTQNDEITYWVKVHSGLTQSDLSIQLGSQTFKDNFIAVPNSVLLQANFVPNVYQINFGNYDPKTIKKLEITYDINNTKRTKTFDENTPLNDYLTIDRQENLIMKVYLKKPYELLVDKFDEKMKVTLIAKNEVVVDDESVMLYELTLNASSLKELVSTEDKYSIEVFTQESKENKDGGASIWLIVGIVGGAVVVIGALIIIIVKAKKRRGTKAKDDFDYNKYFS